MKTAEYSNIRVISQTLSILLIILNFVAMIYFFIKFSIDTVENTLKVKLSISFYYMSQCFAAVNILFFLMASSVITSGIKILMRLYINVAYSHIVSIALSVPYFYIIYLPSINKEVVHNIQNDSQYIRTLASLGLRPSSNSFTIAFQEEVEHVVTIFCILQIITILTNYILIRIFKYATSVKLTAKDCSRRIPDIKSTNQVGLTDRMLLERNILDLNNPIQVNS